MKMMVYPNVKDTVEVPEGTPSGTLFVCVDKTFGKGIVDDTTKKPVSIEDCARGYLPLPMPINAVGSWQDCMAKSKACGKSTAKRDGWTRLSRPKRHGRATGRRIVRAPDAS